MGKQLNYPARPCPSKYYAALIKNTHTQFNCNENIL